MTTKTPLPQRLEQANEALRKALERSPATQHDLLALRAKQYAKEPDPPPPQPLFHALTFTLTHDQGTFGFEMNHVHEVRKLESYTPIPQLPDHVVGLTQLRGELLTLFDLRTLLCTPPHPPPAPGDFFIVLGTPPERCGLLIQHILDTNVPIHTLDPPNDPKPPWVRGKTSSLCLLDAPRLLRDPLLSINQANETTTQPIR